MCVCETCLGTSKTDGETERRGLKIGRNTCHTYTYTHKHTNTQTVSLSFFLIKKTKNGDSEVTSGGRGGQTHVAVDHGKSHPISARAHAIKIPSLPEHQRLNISDE